MAAMRSWVLTGPRVAWRAVAQSEALAEGRLCGDRVFGFSLGDGRDFLWAKQSTIEKALNDFDGKCSAEIASNVPDCEGFPSLSGTIVDDGFIGFPEVEQSRDGAAKKAENRKVKLCKEGKSAEIKEERKNAKA